VDTAQLLTDLGFSLVATRGTAAFLAAEGIACDVVNKVYEGRPNIVDLLKDGEIALVMNTTEGAQAVEDSREIRSVALYDRIPYFTTLAGSHAAALAIRARQEGALGVMALQGMATAGQARPA
jgi:carbamoyl-phosphate synthase large subunit